MTSLLRQLNTHQLNSDETSSPSIPNPESPLFKPHEHPKSIMREYAN